MHLSQSGPFKAPFKAPFTNQIFKPAPGTTSQVPTSIGRPAYAPPEVDLPRVVQYAADTSGCGFWRMFWPEHILNANQKAISTTTTVIDNSEFFYAPVKAVRFQRQATSEQKGFYKYLLELRKKYLVFYCRYN